MVLFGGWPVPWIWPMSSGHAGKCNLPTMPIRKIHCKWRTGIAMGQPKNSSLFVNLPVTFLTVKKLPEDQWSQVQWVFHPEECQCNVDEDISLGNN